MGASTRDLARLGLLSSAALVLSLVESAVPAPLPWLRLGLANIPVLVALMGQGVRAALLVAGIKVLVGSLFGGGLLSPVAVMGGAAAMASLVAMASAHRLRPGLFSTVGVSVAGAVAHQATQLWVARVYTGQPAVLSLLPLGLVAGLVSGVFIGLVARWSLERLADA
jgi:heptaprenyl diphosphate synthase